MVPRSSLKPRANNPFFKCNIVLNNSAKTTTVERWSPSRQYICFDKINSIVVVVIHLCFDMLLLFNDTFLFTRNGWKTKINGDIR